MQALPILEAITGDLQKLKGKNKGKLQRRGRRRLRRWPDASLDEARLLSSIAWLGQQNGSCKRDNSPSLLCSALLSCVTTVGQGESIIRPAGRTLRLVVPSSKQYGVRVSAYHAPPRTFQPDLGGLKVGYS